MLKKHFYDGLVQLAILFSLLGTDINSYLNSGDHNPGINLHEIIQGQNLALTQSAGAFNPNLLTGYLNLKSAHHDPYQREREILQELHKLKPSSKAFPLDITALLLEGGTQTEEGAHVTAEEPPSQEAETPVPLAEPNVGNPGNQAVEGDTAPSPVGELTTEDMDLIKVLWQQDIDLGAGLEVFDAGLRQQEREKQKALEKEKEECSKQRQWQEGVDYFVDSETGEQIPLPPRQPESTPQEPAQDPVMTMDQCMQYLQNLLPDEPQPVQPQAPTPPPVEPDLNQTLQDLASIEELGLGLPQQYSYSHNTQDTVNQPSPVSNINTNVSLVNAINATLDDSLLPSDDLPLPQNLTQLPVMDSFDLNMTQLLLNTDPSEFDQLLTGGMLSEGSLMDFNMSEAGSDSGLSLHDNETSSMSEHESSSAYDMSSNCDANSECDMDVLGATGVSTPSRTDLSDMQFEESDAEEGAVGYQPVFKSCGMEAISNHSYSGNQHSNQPSFQASKEHINHNHTYPLPPGSDKQHMRRGGSRRSGTPTRGSDNDGKAGRRRSKDDRRAKQLKIPFSVDRIIFSPVDDFNDLLTQHPLTDAQLQLIRDIRRRGKNKIAAQNCRKRKIDTIYTLDDDVKQLVEDKERLMKERDMIDKNLRGMRDKFDKLYQEVFRSLRDDNGQPYSPDEFSLQQTSDGNVFLVPTNSTVSPTATRTNPKGKKRKGSKSSK